MIKETIKTPTEAESIMFEIYLYTQEINQLRKYLTGDKLSQEISRVYKKMEECEERLSNL